ncbi:hypothetical protein IW262DRAFT_987991, partial [Armillaria fumosa]
PPSFSLSFVSHRYCRRASCVRRFFLNIRLSPMFWPLIPRLLSLIPVLTVAIAIGRSGINTLVVASQVFWSLVLPFIVFALFWLTTPRHVMSVKNDDEGSVNLSNRISITFLNAAIWLLVVVANIYVLVNLGMGTA